MKILDSTEQNLREIKRLNKVITNLGTMREMVENMDLTCLGLEAEESREELLCNVNGLRSDAITMRWNLIREVPRKQRKGVINNVD